MNPLKKIIIILFSFAFLGWFISQPLIDVGRAKPYFTMPEEGHEISSKELDAFLDIWTKMMNSVFAENLKDLSLKNNSKAPYLFRRWLRLQHWNCERFFYDEQRIRDLLKLVDNEQYLKDARVLSKTSYINLTNIIRDIEKTIDTSTPNKNELELIRKNRFRISEVFSINASKQ